MSQRPGLDLEALIGGDAFIALVEAFGGTRLYVPQRIAPDHEIARAIGEAAARKLSARLAPDVIRVPLARARRALHYRTVRNMSNARIAAALGMTETGVDKLFQRQQDAPKRPGTLPLFPDS